MNTKTNTASKTICDKETRVRIHDIQDEHTYGHTVRSNENMGQTYATRTNLHNTNQTYVWCIPHTTYE